MDDGSVIKTDNPDDSDRAGATIELGNEAFRFHSVSVPVGDIDGAALARLAGAEPAKEFAVLRHLPSGELEGLRPRERIALKWGAQERIFVVRGSTLERFFIGDLAMEWPGKGLAGWQLKVLARARDDQALYWLTPEGERLVEDEDIVDFTRQGAERLELRRVKRTVTVTYNEQPFELERREWSTEELIAVFGVVGGYVLDRIEGDDDFHEMKPGERVKVKEGMAFTAHPPCGHSS